MIKKFPIEKYTFIVEGNKVTAVTSYAGAPVKASAKCHPNDEFNLEIGKKLAAARCNQKVSEKRAVRLYNKYTNSVHAVKEAEKYSRKMLKYYILANDAALNANIELEELIESLY